MKFVTKSLINFAFSFKYLRYCKLSRNLIARCDRAFVSLETRYRCVRISARGFRRSRYGIIDPTVFRKLMRLGNFFCRIPFSFFDRLSLIDESFPAVDLSITNRNYRILGSLWNLSVRTRLTRMLRNSAALGGPTVCVSCGAAAFSLFVVRHTYTHVSPVATHLS